MELNIQFINAFTDVVFKGNSAAVVIIDEWLNEEVMQSIAAENNLSETAFVKPLNNAKFEIKWFSPLTEIDFCGHATLAASYVIFSNNTTINEIVFSTKTVGDLTVFRQGAEHFQMSFPCKSPQEIAKVPEALTKGLSIPPMKVLRSEQAYFVVYQNESQVLSVTPNSTLLKELAPYDVVVTASSAEYDFISRYFWPANGGDEDPVTGSIHAGLTPYWSKVLNKNALTAFQASARGGLLECKIENDRVLISGKAVKYLEGKIFI